MSDGLAIDPQIPLGDGSDDGAVAALANVDLDTGNARVALRDESGRFAPTKEPVTEAPKVEPKAEDEKVVDLKTGKPVDPKLGHNGGPDIDDWLEIPAEEEGKEPVRLKVDEVYQGYQKSKELEVELQKAKEAQPAPDYWINQTTETIKTRERYIDGLRLFERAAQVAEPSRELLDQNSHRYDPAAYMAQLAAAEDAQKRLGAIRQEIAKETASQETQAKQLAQMRAYEQGRVVKTFWPEVFTPDGQKSATDDLLKAYGKFGLTAETINSIDSAWLFALAKDALAARAAQAKAPAIVKKVAGKPRIVSGSARSSVSPKAQASQDAFARLSQSGSDDDAVAAIAGLIS